MRSIAISHACLLKYLDDEGTLLQSYVAGLLAHLDAQVQSEQAKVAHLEPVAHLLLELSVEAAHDCDNQVVDVDT
jgi:hypothetical protein